MSGDDRRQSCARGFLTHPRRQLLPRDELTPAKVRSQSAPETFFYKRAKLRRRWASTLFSLLAQRRFLSSGEGSKQLLARKQTSRPRRDLPRYLLIVAAILMTSIARPAGARYTVPVESLWHIHGIEITFDTPWRLYLPTHQGVFLVGPEGIAERISAQSKDFRSFAKHPRFSGVFYGGVSTPSGMDRGLMKSNDGAKTWMRLSGVAEPPVTFDRLTISPADPRVLYGLHRGLYVSRDGGRSWSARVHPAGRIFSVAASSLDGDVVYAATDEGVMQSADAGKSWQSAQAADSAATMVHVTPQGTIYTYSVGQGLMRATEPSLDWTLVHRNFGRYVLLHFAVDPADADRLFAVTDNSEVIVSEDGGLIWSDLRSRNPAPSR